MAKPNPSNMLPSGTLLEGRYRIERYLSSGGCGNTYLAKDTKFKGTKSRVVVKEFFLNTITHREAQTSRVIVSNPENATTFNKLRHKFRDEADRINGISHPHIVRVSDVFDANDTSYYVMDYIGGGSLNQFAGRITESKAVKYIREVLDALDAVHGEGLYHLDIKPANIMLDKYDNAILIDFGASKMLGSEEGNTLSSTILYTKGYAPTEQMYSDMKHIGAWTDFYAIGATLYNLLTAQQPPLPHIISDEGAEALAIDGADAGVQHFIVQCMRPNISQRPQNVHEMLSMLDASAPQDRVLVVEDEPLPPKEDDDAPSSEDSEPPSGDDATKPTSSGSYEDPNATQRQDSKPQDGDETLPTSGNTPQPPFRPSRPTPPKGAKKQPEKPKEKVQEPNSTKSRTKLYVGVAIVVSFFIGIGAWTMLRNKPATYDLSSTNDSIADSTQIEESASEEVAASPEEREPAKPVEEAAAAPTSPANNVHRTSSVPTNRNNVAANTNHSNNNTNTSNQSAGRQTSNQNTNQSANQSSNRQNSNQSSSRTSSSVGNQSSTPQTRITQNTQPTNSANTSSTTLGGSRRGGVSTGNSSVSSSSSSTSSSSQNASSTLGGSRRR